MLNLCKNSREFCPAGTRTVTALSVRLLADICRLQGVV
jgi:hypothetical protein